MLAMKCHCLEKKQSLHNTFFDICITSYLPLRSLSYSIGDCLRCCCTTISFLGVFSTRIEQAHLTLCCVWVSLGRLEGYCQRWCARHLISHVYCTITMLPEFLSITCARPSSFLSLAYETVEMNWYIHIRKTWHLLISLYPSLSDTKSQMPQQRRKPLPP